MMLRSPTPMPYAPSPAAVGYLRVIPRGTPTQPTGAGGTGPGERGGVA